MRRGNLRDGVHDKVTVILSSPTNKVLRQRNSGTWWRHTSATLMGVSFETYRRRRWDVLMGRRSYVTLRRLGDVPMRRRWVFHLRLF